MAQNREKFSSFGALMAMAGSAVGLGNMWRFPYLVGERGGAAFILLYLVCMLLLALPIFLSESLLGRRAGSNCFGVFKNLPGGGKRWKWFGLLAVVTSMVIFSYYCVIGGWSVQYLLKALGFGFSKAASQAEIGEMFSSMAGGVWAPLIGFALFFISTAAIVQSGVKKGIERFGKVVMPALFFIVIGIAVYVCTLPGSLDGLRYLFIPDFSKITAATFADAMGQSFFSLSLGCGCIMTYSSYMNREDNILSHSVGTAGIDLLFALVAGCAIMPAVFAFGVNPGSGPSLVYETLPFIFSRMPGGGFIAILFFVALLVAALTSSVSMMEVVVAFFIEEARLSRGKAVAVILVICCVIGTLCTLSFGPLSDVKIFSYTIFEACDKLTSNILMTAGALATVIFAGWILPKADFMDELTSSGKYSSTATLCSIARFLIRYVAPVVILAIFVMGLIG